MLNDKRGAIGRMLSHVPQQYREVYFMTGQLGEFIHTKVYSASKNDWMAVYTMVVELPAFKLYQSSFWSAAFLLAIFSVSVWNGGGFYIEVFGRKYVPFLCFSSSSNLIAYLSCKVRKRIGSSA